MSNIYGSGSKGKATRLHAELVRARGKCEACEVGWSPMPKSPTRLECAHIISRRYAATRTDENNAFCLCASHHAHFGLWAMEFARFIHSKIGIAGYDALKDKAERNPRPWKEADWKLEVARLTALLAEVEK